MNKSEFYRKLCDANVSCEELNHMKHSIQKYLDTMLPILPDCPSVAVLKEQLLAIEEMTKFCKEG